MHTRVNEVREGRDEGVKSDVNAAAAAAAAASYYSQAAASNFTFRFRPSFVRPRISPVDHVGLWVSPLQRDG